MAIRWRLHLRQGPRQQRPVAKSDHQRRRRCCSERRLAAGSECNWLLLAGSRSTPLVAVRQQSGIGRVLSYERFQLGSGHGGCRMGSNRCRSGCFSCCGYWLLGCRNGGLGRCCGGDRSGAGFDGWGGSVWCGDLKQLPFSSWYNRYTCLLYTSPSPRDRG